MDVDSGRYTYTDRNGEKHQVPIQRVYSLFQLQEGDHIALLRPLYSHHALVEDIDIGEGEISVIEYSNTFEEFLRDHCSSPVNPGLAEVKRGRYKLENDDVYLIEYEECSDAETAISRARSRLGERSYDVLLNNCEHFALWCKTGISSSEQVIKLVEKMQASEKSVKISVGYAAGAAIGQALIPVPILGGIVGGMVGGFAGRYFGDTAGN